MLAPHTTFVSLSLRDTQSLDHSQTTISCNFPAFEDSIIELVTTAPGSFSSLASVIEKRYLLLHGRLMYPAYLNGAVSEMWSRRGSFELLWAAVVMSHC